MRIARCGVSRQQSPAQGPALIGLVMLDLNRRKIPLSWRVLQSFPNDEVERRWASPTSDEVDLSQSSTPSLAHRRRDPRSLEPIVRQHYPRPACAVVQLTPSGTAPLFSWPRRSLFSSIAPRRPESSRPLAQGRALPNTDAPILLGEIGRPHRSSEIPIDPCPSQGAPKALSAGEPAQLE
jgi:hypothetical protein